MGGGLIPTKPRSVAAGELVELAGIDKRFGGTHALRDVSLTVKRARVLGLVGENGAGKSTLGRILSGTFAADSGSYRLAGEEVRFTNPREALGHGVTLIAQELTLVPSRTVLENVLLGSFPRRFGLQQRRQARRIYDELEARVRFGLDPNAQVASLRLADCQKVEILRALARNSQLLIMDEPTAALARADVQHLRDLIRGLVADGRSVIYISHHLDEVLDVADDVTIMRDGEVVRSSLAADETKDSLVEGMLGGALDSTFPDRGQRSGAGDVVLSVSGLTRVPAFRNVSFDLHRGEILGLTGLVGAGRTELARCIAGVDRPDEGTLSVDGVTVDPRNPAAAIRAGIGLIPESRKEEGLVLRRTVEQNLLLVHARHLSRRGIYRRGPCERQLREVCDEVQVTVRDADRLLDMPVQALSGGNQQKVMIAKWLLRPSRVLIIDEPTRGVDVGAKRAIYDVVARISESGTAVLLISSDTEEVLGLANRVLVMAAGTVTAELDPATAGEDDVMRAAFAHGQAGVAT